MNSGIIVYGGGGHARVVLDCLQDRGVVVQAVVDSKYTGDLLGVPRWKELPPDLSPGTGCVVAIGDNDVRRRVSESLSLSFVNAIHQSSIISKHARVGRGCMILHNTIVQAAAVIGDHVIINTAAQVDHDCVVGDFAHLAPGSILCGNVTVGEGSLVGAGAVVKPGVRIGKWVTIGSGTVVVKDVPDYSVVVGNPARVIKYNQR